MKNLKPCAEPPIRDFDAIRGAKESPRAERLAALRERVAHAYGEYAANRHALNSLGPLSLDAVEKEDLLHCYEGETTPLKLLKNRIKDLQAEWLRAECQYCGLARPGTYDHYLPQSVYPEFSVHAHNLLPCCGDCNQLKRTQTSDAHGRRLYLHLYFDVIDQGEEVLFADIHFSARAGAKVPFADFRLELERVRARPFYQLFERHFEKLDLLDRYRDAAPARLRDHHQSIFVHLRKLPRPEIVASLAEQLEQDKNTWGVHDWRVALLRAVLNTPAFINFALQTSPSVWLEGR